MIRIYFLPYKTVPSLLYFKFIQFFNIILFLLFHIKIYLIIRIFDLKLFNYFQDFCKQLSYFFRLLFSSIPKTYKIWNSIFFQIKYSFFRKIFSILKPCSFLIFRKCFSQCIFIFFIFILDFQKMSKYIINSSIH